MAVSAVHNVNQTESVVRFVEVTVKANSVPVVLFRRVADFVPTHRFNFADRGDLPLAIFQELSKFS